MKSLVGLLLLTVACGTPSQEPSGQTPALPRLLTSIPEHGASDVYPAPLWSGNGEETVIDLTFSEPMTLVGELQLEARDATRKVASLEWSSDNTQLRLFVRSDFSFPRPLADATEYRLDLSGLVNEAGAGLEPNIKLEEKVLVFSTGHHDALLNHSCGHTFFGPFGSVVANAQRNALAPDISKTHVQYTVTLPKQEESDTYAGWVRAKFPTQGPYRLYLDTALPLQLIDPPGEAKEFVLSSTPAACPAITHEATLDVVAGEDLHLFLGPDPVPEHRVIVELVVASN